jgi:hypothetical protein
MIEIKPCNNERCLNCSEHFQELRPGISEVIVTSHFKKDAGDFDTNMILDCKHEYFTRLHRFEEKIEDAYIFRAIINRKHIVYAIQNNKLIFLRAFSNFKEYGKYLADKKFILKQLNSG